MARVRTVDLLSKEKLQEIVLKSITESGWNFQLLNPFGSSPLRLNLTFGDKQEEVAVYIWNVSHGGKTRGKDEFRIQLKGTSLEVGETYKTLLLGWHTEKKVFMAGNAFKHRLFGKSPSIQVKLETLQKAVEHGVAFQTKTSKTGQEIVVTFQSNYIMEYITEIYPQYHPNALIKLPETELKAVENPLDTAIPFEQLNNIPTERRIVVTTINKKVREVKFQKYVYQIYSGKCAMCGLQARLTEAAHIIPVGSNGSDELVNGVLLCRNHHRAFDAGLLAINGEHVIVLNQQTVRRLKESSEDGKLKEFLEMTRIGEKIFLPSDERLYPKKEYLLKNCELKGI